VVVGFGAAGRAGKASSPVGRGAGRGRLRVVDCDDEGVGVVQLERDAEEFPEEGRDGNALEDGGGALTAGRPAHDDAPLEDTGAGPPSLVLFLSLRTRFEYFWVTLALGTAGLADAAPAQPLELEVAPCMPLNPGKLG
jgi:hypothetical protein